jgi:hypothetical protein
MKLKATYLSSGDKFQFEPNGDVYTYIGVLDSEIDELQTCWSYKNADEQELTSDVDYVYVEYDTALCKLVPGQKFSIPFYSRQLIYIARLHQGNYTIVEDRNGNLAKISNHLGVMIED